MVNQNCVEETTLKIIPVIDVLRGVAVHAIRGKRNEYKPLKSVLCESAVPLDVALAIESAGFRDLYVADLDAITGGKTSFSLFKQIADGTGLELMVDAGITDLQKAERLLRSHVSKMIIGTETLKCLDFVAEAVRCFGQERVLVSLDLMGAKILTGFELGELGNPVTLLQEFQAKGVTQFIVLDLTRVGSEEGVNLPILKETLKIIRGKVFVGGGVRDIEDLVELKKMGVSGVLLATALHSGKISLRALRDAGIIVGTVKSLRINRQDRLIV